MTETQTDGFLAALAAVQAEAPALPKDKTNPHFHSKFTGLETIVATIGPLLHKHGLVWIAKPSHDESGPTLDYRLVHVKTGEGEQGTMPLLLTKVDSQGLGSALTYARRYALCSVLNLVSDDDDDGNSASRPASTSDRPGRTADGVAASEKQVKWIEGLVKQKKPSREQLEVLLERVGAEIVVESGWTAKLTGGRDGTASALIDALQNPLPDLAHPSDVPGAADGEFRPSPEEIAEARKLADEAFPVGSA